jgi:hypothetical protein
MVLTILHLKKKERSVKFQCGSAEKKNVVRLFTFLLPSPVLQVHPCCYAAAHISCAKAVHV